MTLQRIAPLEARALIDKGAVLVDVREDGERRRAHIPGSLSMPLSRLAPLSQDARGAEAVIFHCKSGMRTTANAEALARAAGCTAYVLDGGIHAWQAAGLPVEATPLDPDAVARQVQIVCALLVLLGVALGVTGSPAWLALPAAIAVGLLLTGAGGWTGLGRLVAAMPWNR